MFTAAKAHKFSKKARENRLNSWEDLQFQIRVAARQGANHALISEETCTTLRTTLEVFGYTVEFNKDAQMWEVRW